MSESGDQLAEALSLHDRAAALLDERRSVEAEPLGQRALELLSSDPSSVAFVRACLNLSAIREDLGGLDEAEVLSGRAMSVLDTLPPDGGEVDRLRVQALGRLGQVQRAEGRYTDAETSLRSALALAEETLGPDDAEVSTAANNLAVLYKYTAQFGQAESLYLRALTILQARSGPDLDAATIWHNLGGLEHSRGHYAEAEQYARRAMETRQRVLGRDHPAVAADAAALGSILDALGKHDAAEAFFRQALDTFESRLGAEHPEVAVNANNLAAVEYRRGNHAEAERLWRRALAIKEKTLGPSHPELAVTLTNLGVLAHSRGCDAEAKKLWGRALEVLTGHVTPDHPVWRAAEDNLAKVNRDE